ncbi:hypothetical protein GCM10027088_58630 [Nocardia goodfellowii]|uniref:Fructosamine-3-kinase n=1 Tax=Nocardia goodfellowii TaxID=882446 RepID=A0ABS4QI30_9NOCA|nr:fructosamine-3-kinase [Nocardia goodfellowii]
MKSIVPQTFRECGTIGCSETGWHAGIATLRDGSRIFAKALANAGVFQSEAAGLSALAQLGGVRVPTVVHAAPHLLVLETLRPAVKTSSSGKSSHT